MHRRPSRQTLKVGGLTPFTATDFPGKLSAVVFVQGCPWRCGYCHNPHLQQRTATSPLPWQDVHSFLERRTGLIDAVVFSGGEPSMDPGLAHAIHDARTLGFEIGLHTGGTHPERLQQVLPLVDWVGLDIKATLTSYDTITQIRNSGISAFKSLQTILASNVNYEVRTTVHPRLHTDQDILALARQLAGEGVTHYALQVFRATGCQDPELNMVHVSDYPGVNVLADMTSLFPKFILRSSG